MSENVLVRFADNWADEMDVQSWEIIEKTRWNELRFKFEKLDPEFTICIGTNEELPYDNAKAFFKKIKVVDISDDEILTVKKLFGDTKCVDPVGFIGTMEYWVEQSEA